MNVANSQRSANYSSNEYLHGEDADIFGELRSAGINVEKTENVVFAGAEAACARIQLDRAPEEGVVERIRTGSKDILSVALSTL